MSADVVGIAAVCGEGMPRADFETHCTRCEKFVAPEKRVWLELDCFTGAYSPLGAAPLPEKDSQGCFLFGPDCAKHPNKPYPKTGYRI